MIEKKEKLLKLREVAERMGVSYWTAWHWVAAGELRAIRTPSGRIRVPESALEEKISYMTDLHLSRVEKRMRKKRPEYVVISYEGGQK